MQPNSNFVLANLNEHALYMKKLLILLISSVLMIACKSGNGSKKDAGTEKPIITVTIEPLRYFTEAIAGDEYSQHGAQRQQPGNLRSYSPATG